VKVSIYTKAMFVPYITALANYVGMVLRFISYAICLTKAKPLRACMMTWLLAVGLAKVVDVFGLCLFSGGLASAV